MKALIEGKEGFVLKNAAVKLPPWNTRFFIFLTDSTNGLIENCTFIQQSWKEWFIDLFRRRTVKKVN
jgi:hypothetical protein